MELQTLSPAVLRRALKDVTDLDFDVNDSAELDAARYVAQKLLDDPVKADALLACIALSENVGQAEALAGTDRFSGKGLQSAAAAVVVSDRIFANEPDEPEQAATRPMWARTAFEEATAAESARYSVFFPELLGFMTDSDISWSHDVSARWHDVLATASQKIPGPSFLSHAFGLRKPPPPTIFRAAQNYAICKLPVDRQLAVTHFLLGMETLYVVVWLSGVEKSRFTVSRQESGALADALISALDGHPDAARSTLQSLSEILGKKR